MGEGRRCKVKLIKEPSGGRCHVKQPLRETVGQIVPMNPAAPVRGPMHVVKTGKTPVLEGAEWRKLLASIPATTLRDLRDRALIATLTYSFARISAALKMKVEDLRPRGAGWTVRLHEKGGKQQTADRRPLG